MATLFVLRQFAQYLEVSWVGQESLWWEVLLGGLNSSLFTIPSDLVTPDGTAQGWTQWDRLGGWEKDDIFPPFWPLGSARGPTTMATIDKVSSCNSLKREVYWALCIYLKEKQHCEASRQSWLANMYDKDEKWRAHTFTVLLDMKTKRAVLFTSVFGS